MNKPIDISSVVLRTERLTLRPWHMTDLDDLFDYASIDGVGQMAGWLPHKNKEESKKILEMFILEKKTFAIVFGGKVIGSLGIEKYSEAKYPELDKLSCREIGFVLSKDYWGQGLMPEAVREVLRFLFCEEKLDAVLCGHFPYNSQSARVQQKCGFTFFKNSRYHTHYDTVEDEIMNILKKEDYFGK